LLRASTSSRRIRWRLWPFTSAGFRRPNRLGAEGEGFKIAMRTLDIFRTSVAGAALGFAQRALDESIAQAQSRRMFGRRLADLQLTQAALADMATEVDAARLLTYRPRGCATKESESPKRRPWQKMTATETAQRVVDRAVQMFGARGVMLGEVVERFVPGCTSLADLRGCERGSEADHRPRIARPNGVGMTEDKTRPVSFSRWLDTA